VGETATDDGVQNAPWTQLLGIAEPRLTRAGRVVGARVVIHTVSEAFSDMTPASARELAAALRLAADKADLVDLECTPMLERFAEAVGRFAEDA